MANNSFKPKLLRYINGVAEKACHTVDCATQFGLTQALAIMVAYLRVASLLSGIAVAGAWPFMLFALAASSGDLEGLPVSTFTDPLAYTIPMAAGNLIIGLPKLVSGEKTPGFRVVGGVLLIVTTASLIVIAAVMTPKATFFWPVLLWAAFQIVLFAFFVWPARRFKIANPPLQRDAPQAARP